jgi:hypothetical protein
MFFLERKNQKTVGRYDFGAAGDTQPGQSNVFWFFFIKRTAFCHWPLPGVLTFRLPGQLPK